MILKDGILRLAMCVYRVARQVLNYILESIYIYTIPSMYEIIEIVPEW